jgi:putative inorganic carbon (hco3(-)) transporter
MPVRAVWRPPWQAWAAIGLAALATTYILEPSRLRGHWLVITPVAICLGVLLTRRLWELNPAVTACAAIVLTIFSGAWKQMGLGGLPLDRLLVVILLAQVLLRAPGTAGTPRVQLRNIHLLLGLTLVYVIASAAAAHTLTSETGFLSLVDMFGVTPFLMFVLAPSVFSGKRERNMLLVTLVVLGAYLGLTAVFESVGPHALIFPRYIARVDTELPGERAGGPFQSSVVEGFATYACAVAAVLAFAQWRGLRQRCFAAFVAIVCIFGCFVTLERGVWIAAILATTVTAMATHSGRRRLIPAAAVCALLIGGALALSPSLSQKASTRANDQVSVWSRENQTAAGLRMLEAKPLFGFGWASYTTNSLAYFRQTSEYPQSGYVVDEHVGNVAPPLPLHDTYLAFAVELGLVGALLWLASLLWGVGGAVFSRRTEELRPWKLGLLAIMTFYLVVALVDPHEQAFPLLLLWSWAGVAFGSEPLAVQAKRATASLLARGQLSGA